MASDASDWITGALLPVDGGRHMTMNSNGKNENAVPCVRSKI